jgi:hypothetical protein
VIKLFWIAYLTAVLVSAYGLVLAADAPTAIINTGQSPAMYAPDTVYVSPAAVEVPKGVTVVGLTLDRANFLDPTTKITFGLERSLDGGKTWENAGKATTNGGQLMFKGSPISSSGINTAPPPPEGALLRSTLIVTGGSVQTSTAIKMWEAK